MPDTWTLLHDTAHVKIFFVLYSVVLEILQGGSNMTRANWLVYTQIVPVIIEPPCITISLIALCIIFWTTLVQCNMIISVVCEHFVTTLCNKWTIPYKCWSQLVILWTQTDVYLVLYRIIIIRIVAYSPHCPIHVNWLLYSYNCRSFMCSNSVSTLPAQLRMEVQTSHSQKDKWLFRNYLHIWHQKGRW